MKCPKWESEYDRTMADAVSSAPPAPVCKIQ
jgi:hypothetical protein